MTTLRYHYSLQLKDAVTGAAIITAGGKCYVAKNGLPAKQAITDKDGTAATNALTLTRGNIDFWAASLTNGMVDLYIQCPDGQFVVLRNVPPSGQNEIPVNTNRVRQLMVIPFSIADTVTTTETATGFTEPANALIDNTPAVRVTTLESGKTIDVGTLSSDSGDADGFIDGISLTSAALVGATNVNGAVTLGALMYVQDSANSGDDFPEAHISGGKSITYTLASTVTVAAGFIYLPYTLCN